MIGTINMLLDVYRYWSLLRDIQFLKDLRTQIHANKTNPFINSVTE